MQIMGAIEDSMYVKRRGLSRTKPFLGMCERVCGGVENAVIIRISAERLVMLLSLRVLLSLRAYSYCDLSYSFRRMCESIRSSMEHAVIEGPHKHIATTLCYFAIAALFAFAPRLFLC
jgi:hypothetical protein